MLWRRLPRVWKAVVAAATFAATLATLITAWPAIAREWEGVFGVDDEDLVLLRAHLVPFHSTVDDPRQHDQFFLDFHLRSYRLEATLIASADIAVHEGRAAAVGVAGRWGECVVSSDPRQNEPITLASSDDAWIKVGRAIQLPALSGWLTQERLTRLAPVITENPLMLRHDIFVDEPAESAPLPLMSAPAEPI